MDLKNRLKSALHNFDRLNDAQQWYFVYFILSYTVLLTCFGTDYWSSGQTSRQGLWNYCTFNDTVTCCGKLDSVLGYKAYIGATRAFIIIEMIEQLSVIISFLMCIFGGLDRGDAGWIAMFTTLISIPLMVIALAVYGALHDNYSYSEAFKLSWSFWSILFFGSSSVYWAHISAYGRVGGLDLGLQSRGAKIRWFRKRGMLWDELKNIVQQTSSVIPPPAFVVIQLGSNDLGKTKTNDLIEDMQRDILRIALLLPNTPIVWSEVLMRRYGHDGVSIEKARKRLNSAVNNYVPKEGHYIICHPNIRAKEKNFFRYDVTHLSDTGNVIYLNNIQGAFELFLSTNGFKSFPADFTSYYK